MLKESLNFRPVEALDVLSEAFSQTADSLVDFQIPEGLLHNINNLINNENRLVVLLTNHQSYFELETQRKFCQELSKITPDEKPIDTFLFYSAPAVESNIGPLFDSRRETYKDCHLNMLGVIRDVDRQSGKYSESINPEMEEESLKNQKKYINAIRNGACIIIAPFEATLEGGRINPETGKIKGIQQVNENNCLTSLIKKNAIFIPCGIHGSFNVMNPYNHIPSADFMEAFKNPPKEKIVTFKAGELIDSALEKEKGKTFEEICHNSIIEVAKLLPPEAQGVYREELSKKNYVSTF